jgi:type IV pilus assembly protein PilO
MNLLPADPKKQKYLLVGLLPLVGAVFYWQTIHTAQTEENGQLRQRLETLDTRNAAARVQALRAGPELAQRLEQYRTHIDRLERLLPSSEEVPQLLNDMTLRARESGVELALLQPETEVPGAFYTRQVYEISVFGAYHDVGRFLAAVGSLPRIVTATDLRLAPRPQNARTGAGALEATFRIQTYILPTSPETEVRSHART